MSRRQRKETWADQEQLMAIQAYLDSQDDPNRESEDKKFASIEEAVRNTPLPFMGYTEEDLQEPDDWSDYDSDLEECRPTLADGDDRHLADLSQTNSGRLDEQSEDNWSDEESDGSEVSEMEILELLYDLCKQCREESSQSPESIIQIIDPCNELVKTELITVNDRTIVSYLDNSLAREGTSPEESPTLSDESPCDRREEKLGNTEEKSSIRSECQSLSHPMEPNIEAGTAKTPSQAHMEETTHLQESTDGTFIEKERNELISEGIEEDFKSKPPDEVDTPRSIVSIDTTMGDGRHLQDSTADEYVNRPLSEFIFSPTASHSHQQPPPLENIKEERSEGKSTNRGRCSPCLLKFATWCATRLFARTDKRRIKGALAFPFDSHD